MDICQEDIARFAIGFREPWVKVGEDVKLRVKRLGNVHIKLVLAGPAECLAFGYLKALQINGSGFQRRSILAREVRPNDSDHLHVRIVAGGERKIGRRASKDVFGIAEWGAQGIQAKR